jgi:hypothetical protein
MENKEFVPYNIALELKQLGVDEPCFAWYVSKDYGVEIGIVIKSDLIKEAILTPTFSQSFRFFREKYDLNCYIDRGGAKGVYHAFVGNSEHGFLYGNNGNSPSEFTYEEAELACLIKLIEIIKQQDNGK